jgi:hypothetical protein
LRAVACAERTQRTEPRCLPGVSPPGRTSYPRRVHRAPLQLHCRGRRPSARSDGALMAIEHDGSGQRTVLGRCNVSANGRQCQRPTHATGPCVFDPGLARALHVQVPEKIVKAPVSLRTSRNVQALVTCAHAFPNVLEIISCAWCERCGALRDADGEWHRSAAVLSLMDMGYHEP